MIDPRMKIDQLDIRGYFAAMAMQGLASDMENIRAALNAHGNSAEGIALVAVIYADALFKELSK